MTKPQNKKPGFIYVSDSKIIGNKYNHLAILLPIVLHL